MMNVDYEFLFVLVFKMKIKMYILDVSDVFLCVLILMRMFDGLVFVGEMLCVIIIVLSVADEIEEGEFALVVIEGDKLFKNV